MTQQQQSPEEEQQGEERTFLPLGSIVILKGSVKKLVIVSRGSIVQSKFFDYGAFMYPEGMIDTNIAYFNHGNLLKVVHEGYSDDDDKIALDILTDAYTQFQQKQHAHASVPELQTAAPVPVAVPESAHDEDPFAAVRDLMHDDA